MHDFFKNLPALETKRLILRKLKIEDASDIFEFTKSDTITKYLTWDAHKSVETTKKFIESVLTKYKNGEPAQWVLYHKEVNKAIGIAGFITYLSEHKRAEIAFILSEAYGNKGYMTETLMQILEIGFCELNLNRIEAKCDKDNIASETVLKKIGMDYEGMFKEFLFLKNEYKTYKFYSILKSNYNLKR